MKRDRNTGRFQRISGHKNGTKKCGVCEQWRPLSEFHRHKKTWDGLRWRCKTCQLKYYEQTRLRTLANHRKRLYGLSIEQFDALKKRQKGLCAICKEPETGKQNNRIRELCIDHHHKSGKLRGLLCRRCNWVIGQIKEEPKILFLCAKYIKKWNGI